MLNVGKNSRFLIKWKTNIYDFSKEKENEIKVAFAKKYGIEKEHVKVVPEFIIVDKEGNELDMAKDVITNIQDPKFQTKLFKEYLDINNIEGYDFDIICKIDSELNGLIDYTVYDKYRRYSIKWVKWSNFLSYGRDNFLDFTQFNGLTLLNGKNQVGKTTVSNDLIHFLLFGSTNKTKTQAEIFNRHLPEETNVTVEGCITIDGEDYVIKRTLSRPALKKRTAKSKVTQKVEYYKIVGDSEEELVEYIEDQKDESSVKTNKIIKEAIGNESDFDLIMSITESNLDSLIEKKEAERGRILSRWIGMLPLEAKDSLAREKFNQEIKPFLASNTYNKESLNNEIESFKTMVQELIKSNDKYSKENETFEKEIENIEKLLNTLSMSKTQIDKNLLKVDITSLKKKMNDITASGKEKSNEINEIENELKEIGEVEFSVEEYDKINKDIANANVEKGRLGAEYRQLKHEIEHLKKSEFCPTCGKKLDNIDNSKQIADKENKLKEITEEGRILSENIDRFQKKLESMKNDRERYDRKNKISTKKVALQLNLEQLRNSWKECNNIVNEYKKNSEAIDKNNEIDILIRNNEIILKGKRSGREVNLKTIIENEGLINKYNEGITERIKLIKTIDEEEKLVKHWRIYMDLVGKNGISKMVLRRSLPIINAKLKEVLSDVCDFDVEVYVNEKNEVNFYIVKDGIKADIGSGSGFEKTAASLALRFVLGSISTIPRLNYVTLDEVWGRVEESNYEPIHSLLDKMLKEYDFLLLVSHQDQIKNWCEKSLIAEKKSNVSAIRIASNREK